jgi:hypothetical protein
MIKPSEIEVTTTDDAVEAELRVVVRDGVHGDPGRMREMIWNHLFSDLRWEIGKAVAEAMAPVIEHNQAPELSTTYPGSPKSFDRVFDMLRFK